MARSRHGAFALSCFSALVLLAGSSEARFLSRRQARFRPRGRIACLPSSTLGTRYPDPFALGAHSYTHSLFERNGIVYTCRGGHIDVTHLRKLADWTAYLASRSLDVLLDQREQFTFKMREPSRYHVHIAYPSNWAGLSAREREVIARDVAVELAQYLAFTGGTWHEILTWFGFKGAGIWPEYTSAFSWEDNYSNVLGCRIGAAALLDPERDFCQALTALLDEELQTLGVMPKPMAHRAGEAVRGRWFTGDFCFLAMVKRHFDIGLDDGMVTPWLVPGLSECEETAVREYPAPTLAALEERGFSIVLEIEPREWEGGEILAIAHGDDRAKDRIEPARHFGPVMEHIRRQAIDRYGLLVDDGSDGRPEQHGTEERDDLATRAAQWLAEDLS